MANSTTNLDTISAAQANKEVTANALFDAGSPATLYGRRASATSALTWGFYGGVLNIAGTPTEVANGTVTLAASATNFVQASPATGAVSVNATGFLAGNIRLYTIVTGASTVSSYTDHRASMTSGPARSAGTAQLTGGLQVLSLATPGTPTVTPQGTAGTTAYGYRITASSAVGETLASTEGTTATGNATLSATNFNRVAWAAVAGAVDYRVYRTTGGATTGLIGTATATSLDDTGLAASGAVPVVGTSGRAEIDGTARTAGYTVATLPAGTEGMRAYVTDASAPTFLGALTGGGAVRCPVFFNGAAWVAG